MSTQLGIERSRRKIEKRRGNRKGKTRGEDDSARGGRLPHRLNAKKQISVPQKPGMWRYAPAGTSYLVDRVGQGRGTVRGAQNCPTSERHALAWPWGKNRGGPRESPPAAVGEMLYLPFKEARPAVKERNQKRVSARKIAYPVQDCDAKKRKRGHNAMEGKEQVLKRNNCPDLTNRSKPRGVAEKAGRKGGCFTLLKKPNFPPVL